MTKYFFFFFFLISSLLINFLQADPDSSSPLQWNEIFHPMPLLFLFLSLGLFFLFKFLWKQRKETDFIPGPKDLGAHDYNLKKFYGWVPAILGAHVAIALLTNGVQGRLFAIENKLSGNWQHWIGLAEILVALSFFYGVLTRPAAILLGSLWLLGLDLAGLLPMLKTLPYLGFAFFFYLTGRGPHAIDRMLFPDLEPPAKYASQAPFFLRLAIGLTFIVLGITEKFGNLALAQELIEKYPFLNFLGLPNEIFILLAGSLEVLAGLLIITGIFLRTTSLISIIAINASLTIYNWQQLVDYLPLYAALAILLVWESKISHQRLWVEGEGLGKKWNGNTYEYN